MKFVIRHEIRGRVRVQFLSEGYVAYGRLICCIIISAPFPE